MEILEMDRLATFLPGGHEQQSYADMAVESGTREGVLRVELHRFEGVVG